MQLISNWKSIRNELKVHNNAIKCYIISYAIRSRWNNVEMVLFFANVCFGPKQASVQNIIGCWIQDMLSSLFSLLSSLFSLLSWFLNDHHRIRHTSQLLPDTNICRAHRGGWFRIWLAFIRLTALSFVLTTVERRGMLPAATMSRWCWFLKTCVWHPSKDPRSGWAPERHE